MGSKIARLQSGLWLRSKLSATWQQLAMETPGHHPPQLSDLTAMEDAGVGTTPTQVTTPRGTNVRTPHNAYTRVERAAGRIYR